VAVLSERPAATGSKIVQEIFECPELLPAEPADLLLRAGSCEDFGGHAPAL
jgi:hypothetical protein